MPTSVDVGRGGPPPLVAGVHASEAGVLEPTRWNAAALLGDWPMTALISVLAIVPALLLSQFPLLVALAAAGFIAIGLAVWASRTGVTPLVLSLIPATSLANSGLMPASTYFLPTAILGLGIVLSVVVGFVRGRSIPALPWRPLVVVAVVYVVGATIATAFSIRPATSIPYLAGIGIVLVVTLWLGPAILSTTDRTASLFALVGAAGVVMTLLSLLFSLTGPVLWFGRWVGVYLVEEVTLAGHPTGVFLLRTMGPYLAPGVQALALVPAILALLAIRPNLGQRGRLVATVALVIVIAGLLSTFARAGWLAAIVGSGLLAVRHIRSRRIDAASLVVCAIMVAAFGALYLNVVGADYRPEMTIARLPADIRDDADPTGDGALGLLPPIPDPAAVGGTTDPNGQLRIPDRGGSELSGRLEIWSASIRAIRDSPVVGYGPGTVAVVLDPYLTGESRRFVGLTSHNTWLRTWLELGILGIGSFAAFVLVVLVAGLRPRALEPAQQSLRMAALAIFVGLAAAQWFETFLLGGVSMPSFIWSLAAGLLVLSAGGLSSRQPVES